MKWYIEDYEAVLVRTLYQVHGEKSPNEPTFEFKWGKYTLRIKTKPSSSLEVFEDYFKPSSKGGIPTIDRQEIHWSQIDSMTRVYLLEALKKEQKHWSSFEKENFIKDRCEDEYVAQFHEKEAEKLMAKAEWVRQKFGADVITIDDKPVITDEYYEPAMRSLGKWCERSSTPEQMEAWKKIPWLYKLLTLKDGSQVHVLVQKTTTDIMDTLGLRESEVKKVDESQ